jgi:predicted transcriptional regulator
MNKVIIIITIMKYRSKNDIIGHILEAVNSSGDKGLTKTKIMYTVFLSHAPLQKYLSVLLEKGLIKQQHKELEKDDKEQQQSSYYYYYRITDKGRRFLQIYRELSEMVMITHR